MLTQQKLKELFYYDPETGSFINLTQRNSSTKIGAIAGSKYSNGYIYIQLDNKKYRAHRLAWLYTFGELPEKALDHKNEIKDDNRICNLRVATTQENKQNISKPSIANSSGFRGVSWEKKRQKWHAQIKLNGKTKHLGRFNTAEQAYNAYLKAKKELHPFWCERKVV